MPSRLTISAAFILTIGVLASFATTAFLLTTPTVVLILELTMLVSLFACPLALVTGIRLLLVKRALLGFGLLALMLPPAIAASLLFAMLLSE